MINIAIDIGWFLIGLIILAGFVWLAIMVIEFVTGGPIPEKVKQGIWLIVLLLALIALLTILGGGGAPWFRHSLRGAIPGSIDAALSTTATGYL